MAELSFAEAFLSVAAKHLGLGVPDHLGGNRGIGFATLGGGIHDRHAIKSCVTVTPCRT
jgi:hypothetical protein